MERLPSKLDERAERQQRRSPDAVLAVDQDLVATRQSPPHEGDTLVEHLRTCRLEVRRRQMQQIDSRFAKPLLVVAIFLPQVDDGADSMIAREVDCTIDGKATADCKLLRQPMEIGSPRIPLVSHGMNFIFFFLTIFFIFFSILVVRDCFTAVSSSVIVVRKVMDGTTKLRNCSATHDNSFPQRTDRQMSPAEPRLRAVPRSDLEERIQALGPWFHNINLGGIWTAPDHFLGDYPAAKFRRFENELPDFHGKSVLDIGCNAGFYSIEMRRRGASRVLGIDSDDRYLEQARLATETLGYDDVEFAKLDVYDVGALGERFDLVVFMGVLYHLRHPLLALDLIREHVANDMLLFQSMQRGSKHVLPLEGDYEFKETDIFFEASFPKLHFVEHRYSNDWTNWWVPNRACTEAMLRSAGFTIENRIEEEVYLCRKSKRPYAKYGPAAVYPARGAAA